MFLHKGAIHVAWLQLAQKHTNCQHTGLRNRITHVVDMWPRLVTSRVHYVGAVSGSRVQSVPAGTEINKTAQSRKNMSF